MIVWAGKSIWKLISPSKAPRMPKWAHVRREPIHRKQSQKLPSVGGSEENFLVIYTTHESSSMSIMLKRIFLITANRLEHFSYFPRRAILLSTLRSTGRMSSVPLLPTSSLSEREKARNYSKLTSSIHQENISRFQTNNVWQLFVARRRLSALCEQH